MTPTSDQPRWTITSCHHCIVRDDGAELCCYGPPGSDDFEDDDLAAAVADTLNEVPGLRARLEAAEAVIRRLSDGWKPSAPHREPEWIRVISHELTYGVGRDAHVTTEHDTEVEPMSPAEAEAIARARGERS